MIDPSRRQQAIRLYDRYTHEGMDRRELLVRMTAIAGSVAAAELLIAGIAASPAAAAIVPDSDPRLATETLSLVHPGLPEYRVYRAVAYGGRPRRGGIVFVIHENRGLTDHIRDVARRVALAGHEAMAIDFLSPLGGTPTDQDKAREMIGKLDLAQSVAHAATLLHNRAESTGRKPGAIGFCWGGGFVNRLAVAAGDRLDAGVVYYGPAPDPAEAARVAAPLLLHHAGLDERIARTMFPWVEALRAAGKRVTYHGYDGVNHAFHNDSSAERYDKAAAELSWRRTLAFLKRHLGT